ncbi:aldehyde dehydrogenase [Pseudomonas monteilii]|uniref:aldehyde dehydrogenase n=1 Tax=Pseudomonas monteilii TaxID=76759 RepID=UPI00383A2998
MAIRNFADWHRFGLELKKEGRAYIDGSYCDASDGATFECLSPIDGRKLTAVASCSLEDVNRAVAAARREFSKGSWAGLAPAKRKAVLVRFAELIELHTEELALLDTLDMGKPISDSLTIDLPQAIDAIRWSAEAIDKLYGEVAPTPPDQLGLVTREAIGVVAAIVPWNFPLVMACWKLGPALAAGNSVVLKPSEKSPLSALRVAELALSAGIPAGVFNVLPGYGHITGKALALHMDVDAVVFTGSTRIAKQMFVYAGESNMKRVWVEAGGKSPNIVFADTPDLEVAAEAAAAGIAYNQGEVCSAGSRLLVESSIKERFIPMVIKALESWQPGNPLDPATKIGPIVDTIQLENVLRYIDVGHNEGARLVFGGQQLLGETGGTYVQPAVFDNASNGMRIAREEIFGPVLTVIEFSDAQEAISIANDTDYGLAAGIWTSDLSKANQVARALRSGTVWVNLYDGGDMTAPFGGYKQSGNGRDKSLHAFDKYTELKATWIKL